MALHHGHKLRPLPAGDSGLGSSATRETVVRPKTAPMSIIQRNHSVSCYEFRDGDRSGEPAARSAGPLIDSYPTGGNELRGALTVKPLFKTVVVLWTESDPSKSDFQLMDLP